MPLRIVSYQETPNPHALKCALDRATGAPGVSRSFRDASAAGDDPVARAIFAVPGVTGLLLHADWLTVSKAPEASWKTLKPALEQALAALP
jgi:hypothetical protein